MKPLFILIFSAPMMLLLYFFAISGIVPYEAIYSAQISKASFKIPAPYEVKAIHISYNFYKSQRFEEVLNQIKDSQINAVVFEIKDPFGRVAVFDSQRSVALRSLIRKLHRRGVYTIARLVLFEDPKLVEARPDLGIKNKETQHPWRDYSGILWSDPTSREVWEYNINIARETRLLGFDEINFDYIRFPTDGPIRAAEYSNMGEFGSKQNTIVSFLEFAREELGNKVVLSVNVFGMAFINDQVDIGQVISEMAPFVDVIYPMSYPSHYPENFLGYKEPANYPYDVIAYTLKMGSEKLEGQNIIVRPWLQDFSLGAIYDAKKIQAQISAVEDSGADTWALWNASNRYTFSAVQ